MSAARLFEFDRTAPDASPRDEVPLTSPCRFSERLALNAIETGLRVLAGYELHPRRFLDTGTNALVWVSQETRREVHPQRCIRCGTQRADRKGVYACRVQESPGWRLDLCIWKGSPYAKGAECYQRRDNPMRPLRPAPGSTKAIDAGCSCPVEANYDGSGLVGVGLGRGVPMLYDKPGLRGGDPGAPQREYWLHLRCPLHGELLGAAAVDSSAAAM